jgi:hypothetical protein
MSLAVKVHLGMGTNIYLVLVVVYLVIPVVKQVRGGISAGKEIAALVRLNVATNNYLIKYVYVSMYMVYGRKYHKMPYSYPFYFF